MAQELIELYARRRQATGYAFPPDGDWQRDFETRFDYDETDDQLHATAEIKPVSYTHLTLPTNSRV